MATKNLKTRIQNKHDTEANWAKATTFKPLAGELIIYDKDSNNAKPRFKVGDGTTTVTNLPFVAIDYDSRITSLESTVNGLGTAAQKDVGFFATAAQGTKADNAVPNTRKVNNKALSADIRLEPSDVGVTESAFPGLKKTGTITGIKMNGASKGTSGVVDLGTVLTSHQSIRTLNTDNNTSQTVSASESISGTGTINLHKVAKTGSYTDLLNTPTIPDPNNLAKLDAENTFTAKQTINSGYGAVSLKTQGYVEIGASFASKSDIGGLFGYKDDSTGRIYAIMPRDLGFVEYIKMNNSSIEPDDTGIVDLGTVLTTHQTIKTLKTNNDTAQQVSASEAISGSGTINLHKVAKTGNYNDLSNRPTIPTVNNGTLTIKQNGTTVQTFSANQSGNVTANITVPTKASDVNALSLDGGTINKSKTVKMDASANSDGANLKWGTVNSNNPYIGYASDQVDGTFVVGSLLGTNYASGLAIGGGSGNLLWKGTKVATISDIPNISGKLDKSAFSLSGTTLTITV